MLVIQALQQFSHSELNLLSREDISALVRLLSLAEQILSWDFSHCHILLHTIKNLLCPLHNAQIQFRKAPPQLVCLDRGCELSSSSLKGYYYVTKVVHVKMSILIIIGCLNGPIILPYEPPRCL